MNRVALVVSYFPTKLRPHSGMQFYHEAKALAKLVELTVYVVLPEYPESKILQPRRFAHRPEDSPVSLTNARVEHVPYAAFPVVSRLWNGWQCGRMLRPRFEASRPDVVLSYQLYPEAFGAVYAAGSLEIPSVVGAIGSDLRCCGRLLRPLVQRTMKQASFVVTVCDELTGRAVGMGIPRSKVRTIPNGCDPEIFFPQDRQESRRLLGVPPDTRLAVFTGNLVHVKGIPELIQAIAHLNASGVTVDAALIGRGPLEQSLKDRCRSLGLTERVRFLGSKPPAEVARWLSAADVFCLPSYSEGSPNAMVEALRCGRPVVASNVGGIPELLDPTCGILVPPRDVGALAQALHTALDRYWDEGAISTRYRRSWDDMAAETLDVCRAVLADARPFKEPVSTFA